MTHCNLALCATSNSIKAKSLRSGKISGFFGLYFYLGRRGSVAFVNIGRRLHEEPKLHDKHAPAAEDTDILSPFPTAIEKGQLLATKLPPPRRLRDEIDDSVYTPLPTPRYELLCKQRWLARSSFVMPTRSKSTSIQYPRSRIKKTYPVQKWAATITRFGSLI